MSTANEVAACIINLSHSKESPVSNLKLQKLLYYSQAWHLAFSAQPLFSEEIEAWVHGPVVPEVFKTYRSYRWSSISRINDLVIPDDFKNHLEEVWRAYGSLSAYELERMTHSEDPWKIARAGLPPDASSHEVISKDSMQKYYSSLLNG